MNLKATIGMAVMGVSLLLGTGCAGSMQQQNAGPQAWERRTLANGVELHISPEAGPEAQRIAEMFQQEYRSRDISARQ